MVEPMAEPTEKRFRMLRVLYSGEGMPETNHQPKSHERARRFALSRRLSSVRGMRGFVHSLWTTAWGKTFERYFQMSCQCGIGFTEAKSQR